MARPPTSGNKGDFRVEIRPTLVARDLRIAEQRGDAFWERYAIRSGVEATFSDLKRAHGIGKLSVRGFPFDHFDRVVRSIAIEHDFLMIAGTTNATSSKERKSGVPSQES